MGQDAALDWLYMSIPDAAASMRSLRDVQTTERLHACRYSVGENAHLGMTTFQKTDHLD